MWKRQRKLYSIANEKRVPNHQGTFLYSVTLLIRLFNDHSAQGAYVHEVYHQGVTEYKKFMGIVREHKGKVIERLNNMKS